MLLQLVVPGVAGYADLLREAEDARAEVHLEGEGAQDCAPHHDHLFCQVVRSMEHVVPVTGTPATHVGTPPSGEHTPEARLAQHTVAPARGVHGSRAPPAA